MSQRARSNLFLAVLLLAVAVDRRGDGVCRGAETATGPSAKPLSLHARTRVETKPGSGHFNAVTKALAWDPARTAIIVCDMWNQHWCNDATKRVAEMAPRMNEVLIAARNRGVLIIHCPSNTMKFYEGTEQRERARRAVPIATKVALRKNCNLDVKREGPLPIDDSDGGCECDPPCKQGSPWTRQIETLKIEAPDAITDSAEAVYLMKQRGIENVIVMGVHTNMCVLGRPFAIRQLVDQGFHVVLMRDMTDSMYSSRRPPYASHFTGTDLVVEHIERHWCPTVTSADLLGGHEFRFAEDRRPRAVIAIAEPEYHTDRTLPKFALGELGKDFRVSLVFGSQTDPADLPGLEVLADADVLVVSVRRRPLKSDQMKLLRDFVARGKPVLGIRTACHAFSLRGKKPAPALETWESWDADVFGGNYVGHHGKGDRVKIAVLLGSRPDNPITKAIVPMLNDREPLVGNGSLYRVRPLASSATPLLIGSIPGKDDEPVAWINQRADGGKSFYTSLGHADDFSEPAFRTMLVAAMHWLTGT
ncbi:MAG TPA: isochorismatase family protein [Planctomycetaceae bacterium]|jgi:nicotinamidase-related amidase/type 1 glutamine amidotransferase|nr:isochorismatase family protein [Planctomycetaceae bacterium]